MTRADWYGQNTAGSWRQCRKPFRCGQALCLTTVPAGALYLDTNQVTTWPKTKKICAECANTELKD